MPYVLTGGDEEGGGRGTSRDLPARLACPRCVEAAWRGRGTSSADPVCLSGLCGGGWGGGGNCRNSGPACLPAPGSCYATGLASAALYVSSQTKPAQPRGKQAKNALGWAFLGPTRMGLMALKSPPGV